MEAANLQTVAEAANRHVVSVGLERSTGLRRSNQARRDSTLRRVLAGGDAAAVFLAFTIALLLLPHPVARFRDLYLGFATVPLFILIFKLYGLYDRDVKRISHSTVDDLPWVFHAALIGSLLLWLYSKLTPMDQLPLGPLVVFGVLVLVLVPLVRAALRRLSANTLGAEPALLVGGGLMPEVLVNKLRAHPEYGVDIVGSLTPLNSGPGSPPPLTARGVEILGATDELERIAAERSIGRIVVASRDIDEHELAELLRRCRMLSLKVSILPALSDTLGATVEVDDVEGVTVLGVNPPWLPRSSRALKRAMDLVLASIMLVLLAVPLALLALVIKLDSRGPVFFAQQRVGKSGKRFKLYKLRSMHVDAEQRRAELLAHSTDVNWLKLDHDPRITRVGHRLRRLSLDELPQLWNVLRGEMSLVGPRPLIEAEDRLVEGWARGRLDLTPGITGYWQVLGRTRIPFEEMVKLDYLYVTNWSLWEDLRLILRTLPVVVSGRGAN
jgi:exopolysaccharide biosynthesis polyprenyl glycosylphosphotransferase